MVINIFARYGYSNLWIFFQNKGGVVRKDFSDSSSFGQKCKNLIIDSFIND